MKSLIFISTIFVFKLAFAVTQEERCYIDNKTLPGDVDFLVNKCGPNIVKSPRYVEFVDLRDKAVALTKNGCTTTEAKASVEKALSKVNIIVDDCFENIGSTRKQISEMEKNCSEKVKAQLPAQLNKISVLTLAFAKIIQPEALRLQDLKKQCKKIKLSFLKVDVSLQRCGREYQCLNACTSLSLAGFRDLTSFAKYED